MFELVSLIERKLDFKERLSLFGGILLCTLLRSNLKCYSVFSKKLG